MKKKYHLNISYFIIKFDENLFKIFLSLIKDIYYDDIRNFINYSEWLSIAFGF